MKEHFKCYNKLSRHIISFSSLKCDFKSLNEVFAIYCILVLKFKVIIIVNKTIENVEHIGKVNAKVKYSILLLNNSINDNFSIEGSNWINCRYLCI